MNWSSKTKQLFETEGLAGFVGLILRMAAENGGKANGPGYTNLG